MASQWHKSIRRKTEGVRSYTVFMVINVHSTSFVRCPTIDRIYGNQRLTARVSLVCHLKSIYIVITGPVSVNNISPANDIVYIRWSYVDVLM